MANEAIKNFSQFIALHANGQTNQAFTEALHDMIAELSNRVIDRGGKQKGKLTLELDVTLENGMFRVDVNHPKAKMPVPAGQSAVFWATPENFLSESNPKQRDMFRDVPNVTDVRTA